MTTHYLSTLHGLEIVTKTAHSFLPVDLNLADKCPRATESYFCFLHSGNIKPQVKSQPAPKKNAGPVAVVVGKTFEEIVLDSKKDVLIELYAPWCGHCKELEPTYKKLGKKFKDEPNVVIAKMDATANDAPPAYKAEGFPTILFAPANDKKNPVKYEGNRDLESLVKFVKEKATVSLKKAKDEL